MKAQVISLMFLVMMVSANATDTIKIGEVANAGKYVFSALGKIASLVGNDEYHCKEFYGPGKMQGCKVCDDGWKRYCQYDWITWCGCEEGKL